MANKMLIDATHPEETRVVVVNGNRVDEFDFESESRKQLRGNIYLAKITRVEPSLQAAFVEYGGNRHGFLAFSEIHPDYYQIPVADREAILKHQAAQARRAQEEENADGDDEDDTPKATTQAAAANNSDAISTDVHADDEDDDEDHHDTRGEVSEAGAGSDEDDDHHEEAEASGADATAEAEASTDGVAEEHDEDDHAEHASDDHTSDDHAELEVPHADEVIEAVGAEDPHEEAQEDAEPRKQRHNFRNYKIQEVVKRRQIMLVQVVKEERGNKGAALTTFLSLAGRYCVLMPNTARGGGISRKITIAADRKKLKGIAESLDVPEGMGLIIRTAGAKRTKAEIKRDYEYLLRMWESVRELTLRSSAPALVYEEGSLIKRSIRDLYDKDIDAVFVEGDEGYREAKDFMRMLMPSHAKNVQPYKDKQPLFQKFQVEQQLDSMFNPTVTLKSGGYIVINPTEALVSIDVNSGRSTKERNIEQTALRTNLEAAEEVARQMRLRDLAGLIVIDFIDMDENRNNRAVERKLKDSLRTDRARIQVGRISHFGLMEMSRQRMRSGVLEGSTIICPHCTGTGIVRSVESMALHVLRGVEAEAMKGRAAALTAKVPVECAVYILNQKRSNLLDIEDRYELSVYIEADHTLKGSEHRVEQAEARDKTRTRPAAGAINIENTYAEEDDLIVEDVIDEDEDEAEEAEVVAEAREPREARGNREPRGDSDEQNPRKRRRRRRGKKPGEGDSAQADEEDGEEAVAAVAKDGVTADGEAGDSDAAEASGDEGTELDANGEERPRKRRRRGRRGGRRNRRDADGKLIADGEEGSDASEEDGDDDGDEASDETDAPVLLAYSREDVKVAEPVVAVAEVAVEALKAVVAEPVVTEPVVEAAPEPVLETVQAVEAVAEDDDKPKTTRRGWWQRKTE
ncbi:MAG: Rne/Rng family ribonuclease [Parvibaculaceae bacterium]